MADESKSKTDRFLEFLFGRGVRRQSGARFELDVGSSFHNGSPQLYDGQEVIFDSQSQTFKIKDQGGQIRFDQTPDALGWDVGYNPDVYTFPDDGLSWDISTLWDPDSYTGTLLGMPTSFQEDGGIPDVMGENDPEQKGRIREFLGSLPDVFYGELKEFIKNEGPDAAKYILAKVVGDYLTKDDRESAEKMRQKMYEERLKKEEEENVAKERRDALSSKINDRLMARLDDPDPLSGLPRPQRLPSFNPNIQRYNTRDGKGGHVGSLADATMYRHAPSWLAPQEPSGDPWSTDSIRDFSGDATSPWTSGLRWENDPNFNPNASSKRSDPLGDYGTDAGSRQGNALGATSVGRSNDKYTERGREIQSGQRMKPSYGWKESPSSEIKEWTGTTDPKSYKEYLDFIDSFNHSVDARGGGEYEKRTALSPEELYAFQQRQSIGSAYFNDPLEKKSGDDLLNEIGGTFPNSGTMSEQIARHNRTRNIETGGASGSLLMRDYIPPKRYR